MNITIEIDDALKPALELVRIPNEVSRQAMKANIADMDTFDSAEELFKDMGIGVLNGLRNLNETKNE